jgi:hypothetical protein
MKKQKTSVESHMAGLEETHYVILAQSILDLDFGQKISF